MHVIVAGLLAIVIDKSFPKYDSKASVPLQTLEIAMQISLGAVLVTKLHILSSWVVPTVLIAAVPYGVVESVMMITPQPVLHAKVDHVVCTSVTGKALLPAEAHLPSHVN